MARPITQEEFDEALEKLLGNETGASLLMIPGLYEVVSDHFNNDALDAATELRKVRTKTRKPTNRKVG